MIGAPESALQYEAGIKFSFFDDRLILNTALFDVSRDNVATLTTLNVAESVVFDSQKTKGGEVPLDAAITDRWHVSANVTAQHAVITDNPQGITSVGNHPQGAPAYMANLWTTYELSIAGISGFHVGAGLSYLGKSYSDITRSSVRRSTGQRDQSVLAQSLERSPKLFREKLRLFPRGEVTALVHFVEVNQVVVAALSPGTGRLVDLARKHRDRRRNRDIDRIEIVRVIFPIELCRGCRRVRQPVERDVVEHLVFGQ